MKDIGIRNFIYAMIYTIFGITMTTFSSFAIVVQVPSSQGQDDVVVTGPTQVESDESTFFETIQTINQYLRFSIGVICMGVLIFGGIKLITAQGDPAKMKEANKLLMGALIGILIVMFSYALIRIIVNLL